MRQSQNGYYMEKEYNIRKFEDSKCLARDRFKLQTRGVPINDVWNAFGSAYVTLRVDLRNASRIHDVGVEMIHG